LILELDRKDSQVSNLTL